MNYFLLRLVPLRSTFAQDMTEAEAKVMRDHVVYWSGLIETGSALVFGPVADPKGGWGVGIVQVEDDAAARLLAANDPAIRSALDAVYEILPMPRAMIGKQGRSAPCPAGRPGSTGDG